MIGDNSFPIETISDRRVIFRDSAEEKFGFSILAEVRVRIIVPSADFSEQDDRGKLAMPMAIYIYRSMVALDLFIKNES